MSRLYGKVVGPLKMPFQDLMVMCYFVGNYILLDFGAVYWLLVASKTDIKLLRVEKSVVKWLLYRLIPLLGHYYRLTVDIDLHPHLQPQLLPPMLDYYFHYDLD